MGCWPIPLSKEFNIFSEKYYLVCPFYVLLRKPVGLKNKCLQKGFILLEGEIMMRYQLCLLPRNSSRAHALIASSKKVGLSLSWQATVKKVADKLQSTFYNQLTSGFLNNKGFTVPNRGKIGCFQKRYLLWMSVTTEPISMSAPTMQTAVQISNYFSK